MYSLISFTHQWVSTKRQRWLTCSNPSRLTDEHDQGYKALWYLFINLPCLRCWCSTANSPRRSWTKCGLIFLSRALASLGLSQGCHLPISSIVARSCRCIGGATSRELPQLIGYLATNHRKICILFSQSPYYFDSRNCEP